MLGATPSGSGGSRPLHRNSWDSSRGVCPNPGWEGRECGLGGPGRSKLPDDPAEGHQPPPRRLAERDGAEIEVVDLPPDELRQRLDEGKVYLPDRAEVAMMNFFRIGSRLLSARGGSFISTFIPSACAFATTRVPTFPTPTTPMVLPARRKP